MGQFSGSTNHHAFVLASFDPLTVRLLPARFRCSTQRVSPRARTNASYVDPDSRFGTPVKRGEGSAARMTGPQAPSCPEALKGARFPTSTPLFQGVRLRLFIFVLAKAPHSSMWRFPSSSWGVQQMVSPGGLGGERRTAK